MVLLLLICSRCISGGNDYSVSVQPFPGLIPTTGIPMSWYGCFGGEGYGFCETVDSDRTYEFSVVTTDTQQGEITFISDKDGPVNFVLGAYTFDPWLAASPASCFPG